MGEWAYLVEVKGRRKQHVGEGPSEELQRGGGPELGHHVAAGVHGDEGDVPLVVFHVASELRAEGRTREKLAPIGRLLLPELARHRRRFEEPRPPVSAADQQFTSVTCMLWCAAAETQNGKGAHEREKKVNLDVLPQSWQTQRLQAGLGPAVLHIRIGVTVEDDDISQLSGQLLVDG